MMFVMTEIEKNCRSALNIYENIYRRVFERTTEDSVDDSNQSLKTTLSNITNSLSSIAKELGKPEPEICFESVDVPLSETTADIINNVFTHLLRNCVDHGIESPEIRVHQRKQAQGKINLSWEKQAGMLTIYLKDDGQGLNLNSLRDKGEKMGVWLSEDTLQPIEIAQLIFTSGVSTKETVTEISGRGVGMDAAKAYIQNNDGDIKINLLDANPPNYSSAPFEIVVKLPIDKN